MRLIALFFLIIVAAAQCYYPNRQEATDYKYEPCSNNETTFSTCCVFDEGDRCLPNGLCKYPDHYDYRGACTDPTWESCQTVCQSKRAKSWIQVKECATDEYCCNEDAKNGNCCNDGSRRFALDAPDPSSSSTTDSAKPTSTAPDEPPIATSTESVEPTSTSPEDPAVSTSNNPDDDGGSKGGLSASAQGAIGGSIGGVAAIAIGIGAFWFLRRRKSRSGPRQELMGTEISSQDKKYPDGYPQQQYYGPHGSSIPSEVEGFRVLAELGSEPAADRRVHEMNG